MAGLGTMGWAEERMAGLEHVWLAWGMCGWPGARVDGLGNTLLAWGMLIHSACETHVAVQVMTTALEMAPAHERASTVR